MQENLLPVLPLDTAHEFQLRSHLFSTSGTGAAEAQAVPREPVYHREAASAQVLLVLLPAAPKCWKNVDQHLTWSSPPSVERKCSNVDRVACRWDIILKSRRDTYPVQIWHMFYRIFFQIELMPL